MSDSQKISKLSWLFRGWQAILFSMLIGFLYVGAFNKFVVAHEYLKSNFVWFILFSGAFATCGGWLNMVAGFNRIGKRSAAFAGFFVSAMFIYISLTHTYPMLMTKSNGYEGTFVVTVKDRYAQGNKKCGHGRVTIIETMGLLKSDVCRISDAVHDALGRGDKLILIGRVSKYGIFYRDVRLDITQ